MHSFFFSLPPSLCFFLSFGSFTPLMRENRRQTQEEEISTGRVACEMDKQTVSNKGSFFSVNWCHIDIPLLLTGFVFIVFSLFF